MDEILKIPRQRVYSEQVRLLFRGGVRSVVMNYVAMIMIFILLYGRVTTSELIIGLVIIFMVTTFRLAHVLQGAPYYNFFADPAAKSRAFVLGVGIQGLTWGAFLGYCHPQLTIEYEAITFMLVIIAIAVSMITFSTSKPAYFVFVSTVVLPQLLTLMLEGERLQILLAIFVAAGCIIISVVYVWNYNRIYKAIALRFDRADLMDILQKYNRDLESSYENLKRLQYQLTNASLTDELTGIANRRHFNMHLEKEWRRAQRGQTEISCLMIDTDYFKKYNDHYGHQQGDECLKAITQKIRNHMKRPADMAARYGGEEFIVLLPDTVQDVALKMANKIREDILSLSIAHEKSVFGIVTVSIGAASVIPERDSLAEELIKSADQALYKAKAQGRNCVVAA